MTTSSLAKPKGTTFATGYAVNAFGQVSGKAVKASTNFSDGYVVFWNANGAATMLDRQESNCINDNGNLGAWLNTQKIHGPALWNSATGKWSAIAGNWPQDINNAGYVVSQGIVVGPNGFSATLPTNSMGISSAGLIAGNAQGRATLSVPSSGGYTTTALAPYPSGIFRDGNEYAITSGMDVNDTGTVVGSAERRWIENGMDMADDRAMIFQVGGNQFLEDLVNTNGAKLTFALTINEAGWIACRGVRNGTEIAMILIPN
jgi:hypothetical protein